MLTVTVHLLRRLPVRGHRAETPARYPEIDDETSIFGQLLLRLSRGRLSGRGFRRSSSSGGVAGGSSGITRGGSSVTSSFLSRAGSFARRCSGVLGSLSGLFLLRARGQRQRQRDGGENHFCVH